MKADLYKRHRFPAEIVSVFEPLNTHFCLSRHLLKASDYRLKMRERFEAWQKMNELAATA